MILYSIVPEEIVFSKQYAEDLKCEEIEYMGEIVQVLPVSGDKYVINRVVSTYLGAYLNPKLMPGLMVNKHETNIVRRCTDLKI